MEMEETTYRVA